MYHSTSAGAGTAAGTLAYTGSNSIWLAMASFALIAAGAALWRVVPRKESSR